LAVDPHKWLYAPLEAGCVLVRDPEALRNTFSYHPPYYHFGTEVINYVDLGLQNSRGFRALKVWLSLRLAGRTGFVESIGEDIHLNERLNAEVVANEELEALTSSLSITTFRYVPREMRASVGERASEEYLSALNEELLDRIQRSGEAFVSNAVVGGRYVLRTCIVNVNTRKEDVDALPAIVVRHGRQVHDLMRPPR
jgi:glutamate/tyrosine decarboxylase-like PLP-dependent enzyme